MRHATLLYPYTIALPQTIRDRWAHIRQYPDEGAITAEYLILLALLAVAVIAIGAIVVAKLTTKANSITLN
jgi:Flp pilus assembly pilin Flp